VPDLRAATVADRETVVNTVVAAFVADPVFRYLFAADDAAAAPHSAGHPDRTDVSVEQARDLATGEQVAVFAGALFDLRVEHGTVWLVEDGAAVAMWSPPAPGGHAGHLGPLPLPAGPAQRLAEYDRVVGGLIPAHRHWYLGVLATRPDAAGRGWGRLVMAQGLRAAAADALPAYLETASDSNVELYRRSGWQVAATATVGPLAVRVMAHPAG